MLFSECLPRKCDICRSITQELLTQESSFQTTIVGAFPLLTEVCVYKYDTNVWNKSRLIDLKTLHIGWGLQLPQCSIGSSVEYSTIRGMATRSELPMHTLMYHAKAAAKNRSPIIRFNSTILVRTLQISVMKS